MQMTNVYLWPVLRPLLKSSDGRCDCSVPDSSSSKKCIPFFSLPFQSYSSQGRGSSGGGGAGDEDYEIPPITPPNHADPSLLHLMEHESGYPFHSLPHNGLLNTYSYPELPALMMSNMLGQDTHLLSGPMHSVSTPFFVCPFLAAALHDRAGQALR